MPEPLGPVDLLGERLLKVAVRVEAGEAVEIRDLGEKSNLFQVHRLFDE